MAPVIFVLGIVGIGATRIADATQNGFAMQRWTGAWGSDGPIFTGDLNGDRKTDVFIGAKWIRVFQSNAKAVSI